MSGSLIVHIVEALEQPALYIAASQRITAANARAASIFGDGLVGRHFITALRQPGVLDAIERCFSTGEVAQGRYLGADGTHETTYDLRCARVAVPSEGGVLVTLTDVTSRQQAEAMRRDFVANVSHELRTPLTAVLGFIETMQGPAKDDPVAQARFLDIMARETARMNRLVGDLTSLGRVEADARRRPSERVVIADILASVVHTLSPMADDAGAGLNLQITEGAEETVLPGDADQLRQVFTNLIENAIKYGGAGVTIDVAMALPRHEDRLRAQGCRVAVRDTGPGFDPIHIPRLTERFYRVDSHRSREMGGTGLGLAIVKHIIGRHRGRLEIASQPGQGSEFTVILPVI